MSGFRDGGLIIGESDRPVKISELGGVSVISRNGKLYLYDGVNESLILTSSDTSGGSIIVDPITITSSDNSLTVTSVPGGYDITITTAPTPLSITSFTGGGTYEIGTTINSVVLNWSYNYSPDTSQTLNQSIGAISLPLRTYTYTTSFSANRTFTLTAVDSIRGSASANTTVSFLNRRYWGVTTAAVMTEADVKSGSSELSSLISKNITYDCSGGRYFFYAFPASFGSLSTINTKVNNLSFSDWSDNLGGSTTTGFQMNITNGSGYTATYNVYRSYNLQNGSSIPTEMR